MSGTSLLLSGGIDSMVVLHLLIDHSRSVRTVYFDYGQAAAAAERTASQSIAKHFGVDHQQIELKAASRFQDGEIKYRNAALIFNAALFCSADSESMAIGIHAGVPYPDCSQEFLVSVDSILRYASHPLTLHAPLRTWQKAEVIAYAKKNRLPIDLTYSCEAGSVPCGKCQSCLDRVGI